MQVLIKLKISPFQWHKRDRNAELEKVTKRPVAIRKQGPTKNCLFRDHLGYTIHQHDLRKEMDFNNQIWQPSLLCQQAKSEGG